MKDAIAEEIHRHRAEHARKFNYDLHAMCEDLRKRQWESGHKVVGWDPKRKRMVELKRTKAARSETLEARK